MFYQEFFHQPINTERKLLMKKTISDKDKFLKEKVLKELKEQADKILLEKYNIDHSLYFLSSLKQINSSFRHYYYYEIRKTSHIVSHSKSYITFAIVGMTLIKI